MKKNVLAGQSGGPTAAINASLYGVLEEGTRRSGQVGQVYGMCNGIEGFLKDSIVSLSETLSPRQREILRVTPGAYLGSCRYQLPADLSDPVYPAIFEKLEALSVGYFCYIGGNDSMDTVSKLSAYGSRQGSSIRFVGIPKTIDNDLVCTDHTPGYGSAAKYVASSVREIGLDCAVYRQPAVTIVEIMGRHAGWLTAAGALARKYPGDNPMLICLPEQVFDLEAFGRRLEQALQERPDVVVCVSEGIADAEGRFLCEYGSDAGVDTFGHKMLAGCGKVLEQFVRSRFGIKARSVELNICQRCSGLAASRTDLEEAALAGSFGLSQALEGVTEAMAAFQRTGSSPYEIRCTMEDVSRICNQEKKFPAEWITDGGMDIAEEFLSYALPLIQGEVQRPMENGLPLYLYR